MRVLQPKQKDTPGPRDTRCAGHENYEFEQLLCNLQKMQEADQRREGEVQPRSFPAAAKANGWAVLRAFSSVRRRSGGYDLNTRCCPFPY